MTHSEKDLIKNLKISKNEQDFVSLISIYQDQILNFLKSSTYSSGVDYQEVYNKTLMKVWNSIEKFEEKSSFRTWFFKIAKNVSYDEFNKKNKINFREINLPINEEEHQNFIDYNTPESKILSEENLKEVGKKILIIKSNLNKKHKEIFELIFEQGKSYKEVSKILNCSLGTVMSRVFYTRKKVQEMIQKYEHIKIN